MSIQRKSELAVFAVILLTAAFFRFNQLELYPPGLYPDEAMNGNNALHSIETGEYRVFYPENNGREGMFINIQSLSVRVFGNTPWALRAVSALFGTLTVAGLYLLTRRLFNWQIAAIAGFLMAISFWHVVFSRIGFRAIMAPLLLVWGLYFFWRGLSFGKIWNFGLAGALFGLGAHTYLAFRAMPLLILFVMFGWWRTVKNHFSHAKYEQTKKVILTGLQLFVLAGVVVAFPLLHYFYNNPGDFLGRTGQVSIFAADNPVTTLIGNTFKTLGSFAFIGDYNWRHNFSGEPLLFWPVAAFFAAGLIGICMELYRVRKKHGHLPTVHMLLLSWFLIGLLPSIFSNEGLPHALRVILVSPVAFIFAALGMWWFFRMLERWYYLRDVHEVEITLPERHQYHITESTLITILVVLVFLGALASQEYDKYFNRWAPSPEVAGAFNEKYVRLAEKLSALPRHEIKYVLVNIGGVPVIPPGGTVAIPMPAQTVMYLTDTWTAEKQRQKNIYYLTEEQFQQKQYLQNSTVFRLEP